jgi:hypothetical protein
VPGQHVADAGDPAVWAADHGESFERERRTGAFEPRLRFRGRGPRGVARSPRSP